MTICYHNYYYLFFLFLFCLSKEFLSQLMSSILFVCFFLPVLSPISLGHEWWANKCVVLIYLPVTNTYKQFFLHLFLYTVLSFSSFIFLITRAKYKLFATSYSHSFISSCPQITEDLPVSASEHSRTGLIGKNFTCLVFFVVEDFSWLFSSLWQLLLLVTSANKSLGHSIFLCNRMPLLSIPEVKVTF